MKTITLTITLDVPDGAAVTVGSGGTSGLSPAAPIMGGAALGAVPALPDEPPWPDMVPAALEAFPDALVTNPESVLHDTPHVVAAAPSGTWRCPDHGTPAKTVPGGVSKKNGKAYNAFQVCSTQGCERRPGR